WVKNLALKTILVGLMGTIIATIIVFSAMSLTSINTIGTATKQIGGYWLNQLVAAREVKGAFADLRLAYSGYAMVEDAAEFQAQAQPLENAKAQLAAAISKYEAGIVTEAGRAAI